MSCAAIQIANIVSTATAVGAVINLGTVQHRQNKCALSGSASGVILREPGYYTISATVTFTAPAAGNVTVVGRLNGEQLAGVTATETITTPNTEVRTVALTGLVYIPCGSAPATLTLANTGVASTITNVSVTVVKTK